ncbi:MAG: hypothetical protein WC781_04675 [Candidatus Pacearchaeota archaeon]
MAKTIDGLRIPRLVNLLQDWGISIRQGTNHPYIANYGTMRPCPIAESTDAERMVSPWVAQALGRRKFEVYQEMRQNC